MRSEAKFSICTSRYCRHCQVLTLPKEPCWPAVHFIDAGIDTEPIVPQQRSAIESTDNEASLGRRQFEAAVPLLLQTVRLIERKSTPVFDQPDSDLIRFAAHYCLEIDG